MSYKFLSQLFFSSFIFCYASAQNDRPANEAETIVINKAVNIIVPMIDRFQNDTWQKESGGADAPQYYSVQRHPNIPINTGPFNDWHFTIRQGSNFYNKNIKAYYDKVNNVTLDASDTKAMEQLVKEGQKIKDISNLYVEVHVNEVVIPVKPLKNSAADLKIPGCYFAYKQPADKLIGRDENTPASYVLIFGNWSTATTPADRQDYQFKFIHPKGTPFIENIVIIISGSSDRINEILKTTDWQKVNDGLTR